MASNANIAAAERFALTLEGGLVVSTTIEDRDAEHQVSDISIDPVNMPNDNDTLKIFISMGTPPMSEFEKLLIRYYSLYGDGVLNTFLRTGNASYGILAKDPNYKYNRLIKISNVLQSYFPELKDTHDDLYAQKLQWYIFVNLYNLIQRIPPIPTNTPFTTYRGTAGWYLPENKDTFHYFLSFTSTSLDHWIGEVFAAGGREYNKEKGNVHPDRMYVYYVHPACRYAFLPPMGSIPYEQEILLCPYNRFIYSHSKDENHKVFVVLPTDLKIPDGFDVFMEWNKTVSSLAGEIKGGKRKRTRSHRRRSTRRQKGGAEIQSAPITSFPGNRPTSSEKDLIRSIVNYMEPSPLSAANKQKLK
jgi:hypothetical protein